MVTEGVVYLYVLVQAMDISMVFGLFIGIIQHVFWGILSYKTDVSFELSFTTRIKIMLIAHKCTHTHSIIVYII